MDLKNATVLVTGGNRGIGKALVDALLVAGARKVYAASRDPARIEERDGVVALRLDVTDSERVAAAANDASDVNLLINNAGIADFGDALDSLPETVTGMFRTNFGGPLAMSKAFAPVIEGNGGGAIVNVLSVVALASFPAFAGYCASKAAAWSLTQSLRATLGRRGIAVHAVFPGPVDTDMAKSLAMPKTSPEDVARAIVQGIQDGREDIFPDPMAVQVYDTWRHDPKAIEQQFAAA